MVLLVAAALVIACIAVVVYPFLKTRSPNPVDRARDGAGPATGELEAVLDSIRSLQLDRQLGNVPEALYREQLRAYRFQAASVLRQQSGAQAADAEGPDLSEGTEP